MYVLSAAQMQGLDAFAMAQGMPSLVLMERAVVSMAAVLWQRIQQQQGFEPRAVRGSRRVFIFCGPGNNGGDGLALARLLCDAHWETAGFQVEVCQVFAEKASPENRQQQNMLQHLPVIRHTLTPEWLQTMPCLNAQDVVIDAVFGVGQTRAVEGIVAELFDLLNSSPALRVALDVPSGLHTDTGEVLGTPFAAQLTLSCAFLKYVHGADQALAYVGEVQTVSIGIPEPWVSQYRGTSAWMHVLSPAEGPQCLAPFLPQRLPTAHKGSQGRLGLFVGSPGMAGAAILSFQGALESGPGYVFGYTHQDLVMALVPQLPEVQLQKFPAPGELPACLKTLDVALLGPGLGRSQEAVALCHGIFDTACDLQVPLVIDADALFALNTWLATTELSLPQGTVITPHPGEAAALLNWTTAQVQADRFAALQALVAKVGCDVVLKGACTLIALGGTFYMNFTGNAGLARGGAGDVLAGLLAGLMPQSKAAAPLAVYWHGLTADHVAAKYGVQGVRIQRLLTHLAEVWPSLCVR